LLSSGFPAKGQADLMSDPIVEVASAALIADRLKSLAVEIAGAYEGRELTIFGVQEDSFMFLADLLRALPNPVRTSFLKYDHQTLAGVQDISFATQTDLVGRDVLLVEGVLDTGVTQDYLMRQLDARGARSVKLCVLVDKPDRRRVELQPDWRAVETHADYVFGYGLGFQDRWRELPYLATFEAAEGG
jgi:hypoxanthine phosphoribosyltransferase